jgi:hypothetical protein
MRVVRIAMLATGMAALAAMSLAGAQALQPLRVIPAIPTAGEEFVIQVTGVTPGMPTTHERTAVKVDAASILLDATIVEGDFSVPGAYRVGAVVTVPTPGSYQLDMQARSQSSQYPRRNIGSVTVGPAVPASAPLARNLSGHWLAPDEMGWGVNVTQGESGQLFVIWYTYRPSEPQSTLDGRQPGIWLVMPSGRWISPTEFRGVLYETRGTPSDLPFTSAQTNTFPAGVATLRVLSTDRIEFVADAGVGLAPEMNKRKTLQRFVF